METAVYVLTVKALAAALDQWGADECVGIASDGRIDVMVYGRMVDGVLVFDEPLVIDLTVDARARCEPSDS